MANDTLGGMVAKVRRAVFLRDAAAMSEGTEYGECLAIPVTSTVILPLLT